MSLWLIVPLLPEQVSEIENFINQHQWFFDGGGNAVFKINGIVDDLLMTIVPNKNIHLLQIPDLSLYDAWNLCLDYLLQKKIHENSYISFLGLDDLLSNEFIVSSKNLILEKNNIDFIYGNSRHIFNNRYIDRDTIDHPALFGVNNFSFDISHPGMLNRWGVISKFRFDTNFRLAADFDFYIGIALQSKVSYKKINCIQAIIGAEGVSNGANAKKIYLQEWMKIEKKRKINLNLELGRTRFVELIARWPYLYKNIRIAWWMIKGKNNIY